MWVGRLGNAKEFREKGCIDPCGVSACERQKFQGLPGVLHGGDEVAADGRSGQPWRAQKRTAGRGYGGQR
jgi:hypothetical protein